MTSHTTLETAELADEIRELLRQYLGEDAARFYGEEATHYLKVDHNDGWFAKWRIRIGRDENDAMGMSSYESDDLLMIFEAVLAHGDVRRKFLQRTNQEERA